jgi:hypothetical protein
MPAAAIVLAMALAIERSSVVWCSCRVEPPKIQVGAISWCARRRLPRREEVADVDRGRRAGRRREQEIFVVLRARFAAGAQVLPQLPELGELPAHLAVHRATARRTAEHPGSDLQGHDAEDQNAENNSKLVCFLCSSALTAHRPPPSTMPPERAGSSWDQ